MSLDSDVIVDRRRMRRKLTFWRVAAALVAIAAIVTVGVLATPAGRSAFTGVGLDRAGQYRGPDPQRSAIASRRWSGWKNLGARPSIVHINSPGGTTAGSEQLYDALVRLKAKKPLVVVVEGLAASGGYITAIAADHIVAQQSSLVGSIGVLFQFPNFTELMKTVGVKVEEVKSSPLKAAPNGFEPTSPEARAALDALVKDSYAWFRGLVKERRGMDDAHARKSRRRPRLHRPSGGRSQADRSARRREDRDRVAGRAKERQKRSAGAGFQTVAAVRRPDFPAHGGLDYARCARA